MRTFTQMSLHIFVGLIGVLLGAHYSQVQIPNLQVEYIVPNQAPIVHIQGIRDGNVYGTTAGSVTLIVGTITQSTHAFADFTLPAGPLLTHQISTIIPTGMHYIASKRGTKIYAVSASRVRSIPPENRLYFATKQQAIAAGFKE